MFPTGCRTKKIRYNPEMDSAIFEVEQHIRNCRDVSLRNIKRVYVREPLYWRFLSEARNLVERRRKDNVIELFVRFDGVQLIPRRDPTTY